MRIATLLLCLCCLPAMAAGAAVAEGDSAPGFKQLLAESEMQWTPPAGFEPSPVRPNPIFFYDQAVRDPDGKLEILLMVRPLARMQVDYEDPHGSAPDPNHVFPLMFQSLVTSLSGGGHSPVSEFPAEQAAERFNAQWASAAVFDVVPRLGASHRQALLVAMHRQRLADAYALFLFDDYQAVKPLIDANLGALSFKAAPVEQ